MSAELMILIHTVFMLAAGSLALAALAAGLRLLRDLLAPGAPSSPDPETLYLAFDH